MKHATNNAGLDDPSRVVICKPNESYLIGHESSESGMYEGQRRGDHRFVDNDKGIYPSFPKRIKTKRGEARGGVEDARHVGFAGLDLCWVSNL